MLQLYILGLDLSSKQEYLWELLEEAVLHNRPCVVPE